MSRLIPQNRLRDDLQRLDDKGLETMLLGLAPYYARPRRHELAAALNRLRTLEVTQLS